MGMGVTAQCKTAWGRPFPLKATWSSETACLHQVTSNSLFYYQDPAFSSSRMPRPLQTCPLPPSSPSSSSWCCSRWDWTAQWVDGRQHSGPRGYLVYGLTPANTRRNNYKYCTVTKGFRAWLVSPCAFCKTATRTQFWPKMKWFFSVILWQFVTDLETQPEHLVHKHLMERSLPGSFSLVLVNLQINY